MLPRDDSNQPRQGFGNTELAALLFGQVVRRDADRFRQLALCEPQLRPYFPQFLRSHWHVCLRYTAFERSRQMIFLLGSCAFALELFRHSFIAEY
jgi:hypothetical protein